MLYRQSCFAWRPAARCTGHRRVSALSRPLSRQRINRCSAVKDANSSFDDPSTVLGNASSPEDDLLDEGFATASGAEQPSSSTPAGGGRVLDEDPRWRIEPPVDAWPAHKSLGGQPSQQWSARRLERRQSIGEQVAYVINSSAANIVGFRKQSKNALQQMERELSVDEADDDLGPSSNPSANTPAARPLPWWNISSIGETTERIRYAYYNWRTGNWSDLQLFLVLNVVIVGVASVIKHFILDRLDDCQDVCQNDWWLDIYTVTVWVFGDGFPDAGDRASTLFFSLFVAALGVAAFALSLALVQQVVFDFYTSYVQRGSPIYEAGHYVVLGWGDSQADLELIERVLTQLCCAHQQDGGCTVGVLCKRGKLEMEEMFSKSIPEEARCGTRIIFRQGNPLAAEGLKQMNVQYAAAVVVVSDSNKEATAADAQCIRVAILLDELTNKNASPSLKKSHVIVELMDEDSIDLLEYSCSQRVLALPSNVLNARRIAATARHPLTAMLSRYQFDFRSHAQLFLEYFPQFQGKPFRELQPHFPDAIVVGLINNRTAEMVISPGDRRLTSDDLVLIMRSASGYSRFSYKPLDQPHMMDAGDWSPYDYGRYANLSSWCVSVAKNSSSSMSHDTEMPTGYQSLVDGEQTSSFTSSGMPPNQAILFEGSVSTMTMATMNEADDSDLYLLPREYLSSVDELQQVLICGFSNKKFMRTLLKEMDTGPFALKPGSSILLYNQHPEQEIEDFCDSLCLDNIVVLHQKGNPLRDSEMHTDLDVTEFQCAIVLCDQLWLDAIVNENEADNFLQTKRIDAAILMVQLNIRKELEMADHADINIICEKFTVESAVTRFEDTMRLPLGNCLNNNSFSAKAVVQTMLQPKLLLPLLEWGNVADLEIQDSSNFARPNETLTYWQLMARVASVQQVLIGYYDVPTSISSPVALHVNPSADARERGRVWNREDGRTKIVTMAQKDAPRVLPMHSLDDGQKDPLAALVGPRPPALTSKVMAKKQLAREKAIMKGLADQPTSLGKGV